MGGTVGCLRHMLTPDLGMRGICTPLDNSCSDPSDCDHFNTCGAGTECYCVQGVSGGPQCVYGDSQCVGCTTDADCGPNGVCSLAFVDCFPEFVAGVCYTQEASCANPAKVRSIFKRRVAAIA